MLFGKAQIEHIDQLVQLRLDYLAEDHGSLSPQESEQIASKLPEYYKKHLNSDFFVYICCSGDEIVSCVFLLVTEKPANPDFLNGKTGSLLNVYTKLEHRHNGYAKKLLEMMLDDARAMCLDFVELKATDDGYGLYKKVGFKDAVSKYHNMKFVL
ncbi:MAG: GNAT family N-acetyltransferase [Ruminococcus sp.]|nr:GNAT family N-acetyltransferase [Ruminococcus sp.]